MKQNRSAFFSSLLVVLLALGGTSPVAQAGTVAVDCQAKKGNSINDALALLTKQGPHTINISGTCTEAIVIENFDDLTLAGTPGTTLNSPTNPEFGVVIWIAKSRSVTIRDLIINGDPDLEFGTGGISCGFFSDCILINVTIQNGVNGITYARSTGIVGDDAIVQNNACQGVIAIRNSHVRVGAWPASGSATIRNNGSADCGGTGIHIDDESYVDMFNSSVQNTVAGNGVTVNFDSFLGLFNSTITGNDAAGISGGPSAFVRLRNSGAGGTNTITGNAQSGIILRDLSFLQINGSRSISGNGAPDVLCSKSSAKTAGTGGSATPNLGGGTTNCTEPTP